MALPAQDAGPTAGGRVLNAAEFLDSRTGRSLLLLGRLLFWTVAAVVVVALCRRGITLGDEGYLLSQAADVLAGKVPYRDLDLFVTPGAWYLLAGLFSLAGPGVLVTRYAAAVSLLLAMLVVRRIVRSTGSPLWGDFAAGLVAVFAVWAWPAWSFAFYSPWATLVALAALACLLQWMRSSRDAWLLACGLCLGLAIAFKQNYGVYAAAGCAAVVVLEAVAAAGPVRIDWRTFSVRCGRAALLLATGGALVLVPLVAWLAHEGALGAAFDSLVLRPFQGFVDAHSIPYLSLSDLWKRTQIWTMGGLGYMAVPVTATGVRFGWNPVAVYLVEILHVALYWIPPFAFAVLGFRGLRRLRHAPSLVERSLLAITVFAAAFYLGVFPRADYNHVINVYPPVLAMLAAAASVLFGEGRWRSGGPARRAAAAAACAVFLGFAGFAAVWMNEIRKIYWIPIEAARGGVLVDPLVAATLAQEIELVRSLAAENEPVFALPGLSMIPFLAERPMPTRYYNYYSVHIAHDGGKDAADEIERSGAKVVLADYNNFFSDPEGLLTYGPNLASYLNRTFEPSVILSNQARLLLVRRDEPLAEIPSRVLWLSCEIRPGGTPGRYLREHLLFRSLYHSYKNAWGTRNERITICQVQVPAAAYLRAGLQLRQPAVALSPATARAEAWLFPARGRPHLLFDHEWALASENAANRRTAAEVGVDLSKWDSQIVTILLRSIVEGEIPPGAVDHHGLTVMWDDLRIESPDYADASSPDGG